MGGGGTTVRRATGWHRRCWRQRTGGWKGEWLDWTVRRLDGWPVSANLATIRSGARRFGDAATARAFIVRGMRPYERLLAWRHCHRLALFTYRVTDGFPKSELYGITSQMRRAAASAATNIAEGSAKRGTSALRRFMD